MQKWLVKEGDEVEQFQNLADVSTDKLFTQIPSTEHGRIHKLHIAEGAPCQVGGLLLELDVDEGSAVQEVKKEHTEKDTTTTKPLPTSVTSSQAVAAQGSQTGKSLATPAVREYARQKNIDINQVVVNEALVGNCSRGQSDSRGHRQICLEGQLSP